MADDPELIETLAAGFREGGWTVVKVENGRFTGVYSAPSAGPLPWDLYQTSGATIHFRPDKPLPDNLVEKLVKARMAQTEAGTS